MLLLLSSLEFQTKLYPLLTKVTTTGYWPNFFFFSRLWTSTSSRSIVEGLNGVNRQPSKGQKSNRQPSNTENFNRQPSIKSGMINRQTSFIMDYYSVRPWY